MKILLILPYDNVYRYRGFSKKSIGAWAPLTLTLLAALVPPELGAHIDIIDEGVQKACDGDKTYDVVGITCVASSAMRAYSLAGYWQNKGAFVVLGGPHVTLMPEEAKKHANAIVVGAAEKTWPQLLRDFKAGTPQKVYRADDTAPLSSPIPRRDLQARFSYFPAPAILANRGCRNRCHFCSIHKIYSHPHAARSIAEVIAEIKYLHPKTYSLPRIAQRAITAPRHKWLVLAANFGLRGALNAFMAEDTGYSLLLSGL